MMGTIAIWALFVVFGAVAALYVSVVGFALSAVAIIAGLGLFSSLIGGGVTGWALLGALVAVQAGYAAGLVGSAFLGQAWPLSKTPARLEGDLHIHHD